MKRAINLLLIPVIFPVLMQAAQAPQESHLFDSDGNEYYFSIDKNYYQQGEYCSFVFRFTNNTGDTIEWVFSWYDFQYDLWLVRADVQDTVWIGSQYRAYSPLEQTIEIPPGDTYSQESEAGFFNFLPNSWVDKGNYYLLGRWMPSYQELPATHVFPITILGAGEEPPILPEFVQLHYNFPNPFNSQTTIYYCTASSRKIEITVHDLLGQKITTLASGLHYPGTHKVNLKAGYLPSGVYFYRLESETFVDIKKMVLIK